MRLARRSTYRQSMLRLAASSRFNLRHISPLPGAGAGTRSTRHRCFSSSIRAKCAPAWAHACPAHGVGSPALRKIRPCFSGAGEAPCKAMKQHEKIKRKTPEARDKISGTGANSANPRPARSLRPGTNPHPRLNNHSNTDITTPIPTPVSNPIVGW
jgi:hypothetical protein